MTFGFLSTEGHTLPGYRAFFTVARRRLSALMMSGDFMHSHADASEALFESGRNIKWATMMFVLICLMPTALLSLK